MALAASRVRVEQHGDAVIGTRNDFLYDEKTGLLAEKRTVVAQVPIQGGGTVLVKGEEVQAVTTRSRLPNYTPRNALTYPVEDHRTVRPEKRDTKPLGSKICPACGCIMCLASIAIIIATATTGVLSCIPLHLAAVTAIILASIVCWMACLCCFCAIKPDLETYSFYLVGCCCVTLVMVCFIVTIGLNSFYVFENIDVVTDPWMSNGTDCSYVGEPLGVAVLSYVVLVLFFVFCCCTMVECLQSTAVKLLWE